MAGVFKQVRRVIVELVAVPEEEVVPGASLVQDLGVDSQDFVNIIAALEGEFSVGDRALEIADEELEGLETVQQLVDLLERKGMGR